MTGLPGWLGPAAVGLLAFAAAGCLGTGTRRFDAPCREMRASVAREMLRDSREIPLLDVRARPVPALKGAVQIPLGELGGRLHEMSRYRSSPVVVVADDGDAARKACEQLAAEGFRYAIFVPEGAEGLFAGVRGAGVEPDGPGKRP